MKTTKPFCIDSDLIKELSKINASSLVNELLRDYFNQINEGNLAKNKQKLTGLLSEKKILCKKVRELRQKIKEIETKETEVVILI